ncbi:hypothetical protein M8J75_016302 [Diaphorina citri]|nr:hypothetical protein M8J75_016302 [Diaphorina citri]
MVRMVSPSLAITSNSKNSLHSSLRPVLKLAAWFGLLPVHSTVSPDKAHLRYKLSTWGVLYAMLTCVFSFISIILVIYRTIRNDFSYKNMVDLMFFVNSILIYSLFTQLATKWARLMKAWQQLEWDMRAYGYPQDLAVRCKLVTFIFMFLAIVEHISFIITRIVDSTQCSDQIPLVKAYFLNVYHQTFFVIPYSLPLAIFLALFNFILTCAWNFMDLFIIILSNALAIRFQQLNQRLASVRGKVLPSSTWRQLRETYNELSCLTKLLDHSLSPIVLLSFANNLYFMSLQLFNSLKPIQSVWEAIYFVYSFTCLLVRICAVSLYAASINDASKECTGVLFSIPSESYCVELWRVLKLYTLYSPLSDKVVGKNTAVKEINTTCYTDGWLFKFKVTDKTEVCQLMTEAKYQEFLKSDATAKQ